MLSETLRTSAAAPPSHEHQWTPRDDMMPKHSSYYQSDDLPSAHRPKPAARPPPSPSSARSPSPFLERAEDSGAARRPLEPVIPPGVAAEREEVERQRQWRSLRWNELHYHHKESLAKELEQRILLLLWITVLLVHLHLTCLCIVLLVLHVDEVGVVVGGGVFVVTLLGYLITQLRVHLLTFAFLCVDPVVFLVQLFYAGYCLVELRMGLFGHHGYVFLHLVSCLVLTVCVVVAWSLYRQEEVTEEWARQEEELDDLIQRTTMSEYLRMQHRAEHQETNSCFV